MLASVHTFLHIGINQKPDVELIQSNKLWHVDNWCKETMAVVKFNVNHHESAMKHRSRYKYELFFFYIVTL